MSDQPQIAERAAQHYAGITMTVIMDGISAAVDQAFPELFGWLAGQGIAASAPPFLRYLVIDMAGELEIELGVPAAEPIAPAGRIRPGLLPAGRYVVARHTGSYDGLIAANAALQEWASDHGITFDSWDTARGTAWQCRVEHYLTDPSQEPDPGKWETELAYLTRAPGNSASADQPAHPGRTGGWPRGRHRSARE